MTGHSASDPECAIRPSGELHPQIMPPSGHVANGDQRVDGGNPAPVAAGGFANWKDRPPLTADAPSIHVSENVRLPETYTDAMLDTGCDTNTLTSRELARGTPAVVATVTP